LPIAVGAAVDATVVVRSGIMVFTVEIVGGRRVVMGSGVWV